MFLQAVQHTPRVGGVRLPRFSANSMHPGPTTLNDPGGTSMSNKSQVTNSSKMGKYHAVLLHEVDECTQNNSGLTYSEVYSVNRTVRPY